MKTAPELLRDYLEFIPTPQKAAALFAEDGVVELPYVDARAQGPGAIQAFLEDVLAQIPDFAIKDVQLLIETPERAFGEYHVEAAVPATGKVYKQHYFGMLVAEGGKIKLLREALDTNAAYTAFGVEPETTG
jgi:ketosteroid isomerase-like protein